VVEDLHWLDSESQALLDALVESLPAARIALLVNYRPEYTHTWGNKSCYTQVRIDALGQASAEELLSALLGEDATIESLKTLLIDRTEGNPFFLEESVRSLVETGVLDGERGASRLTRPVDTIRVPATVESVLAARIDRLPSEEKRLLQTAAVIGKDVPYPLLQAIAETADDPLRTGISHLQAGELLYPISLFPELELTFKHALTHDVAYGSLLQDRRKALHARTVAAIEALYPDRLDEHIERLAHHALRADDWPGAVKYARAAGQRAIDRSAYREALTWLEQAYAGLAHLPDGREKLELGVDVRLDLGHALSPLFSRERLLECMREAEEIAGELGDEARLRSVLVLLAGGLRMSGEYDRAVEVAQRALSLARTADDSLIIIFSAFLLAHTYRHRGELRRAAEALALCIEELPRIPHRTPPRWLATSVGNCRSTLAWTLAEIGDFDDAIAHAAEGMRDSEAVDDPQSVAVAANILGRVYVDRGDVERALPHLEHGLAVAQRFDLPNAEIWALTLLGAVNTLTGQPVEAARSLERGLAIADQNAVVNNLSLWIAYLGEAHLLAGRIAEALRLATSALDMARQRHERSHEAYALRLLGQIATSDATPEVGDAETHYQEALALAEELGMRPLQAHCHLGLGKLYRRTGRPDEARAELATAVAMLTEMGMAFWLPEAERELAGASA
jgi:predicted ATPase